MTNPLTSWLNDKSLTCWLNDKSLWQADWMTNPCDKLTERQTWQADWMTNPLTSWLNKQPFDRLTEWPTLWQADWIPTLWQADWMTNFCNNFINNDLLFKYFLYSPSVLSEKFYISSLKLEWLHILTHLVSRHL